MDERRNMISNIKRGNRYVSKIKDTQYKEELVSNVSFREKQKVKSPVALI